MFVGRAMEHGGEELLVKNIFGVGQILGDFLLDGAAFLFPKLLVGQQITHPGGLDAQGHVQILGGGGKKILGDGLLGVGVVIAAHGRGGGGQLIGR